MQLLEAKIINSSHPGRYEGATYNYIDRRQQRVETFVDIHKIKFLCKAKTKQKSIYSHLLLAKIINSSHPGRYEGATCNNIYRRQQQVETFVDINKIKFLCKANTEIKSIYSDLLVAKIINSSHLRSSHQLYKTKRTNERHSSMSSRNKQIIMECQTF